MAKNLSNSFYKNLKKEYSLKLGCDFDALEEENQIYSTPYPIINFMLSGDFFGGLETHKLYMFGGKKASFKSSLLLICAKSIMMANPNAYLLFYDSEYVATKDNFEKVGITQDRVIEPRRICDAKTLTQLVLQDAANIIQAEGNEDKTFIIAIDGVGMLADSASITKSINEEDSNQMGNRAKELNKLCMGLLPIMSNHNVIVLVCNHVYDEIGKLYPSQVFKGGEGLLNIASTALLMSPANLGTTKDEETKIAKGTTFSLVTKKSRSISRDFKLKLDVSYDHGIFPFSGLFDLLKDMSSHLKQVSAQKYSLITTDGEIIPVNGKDDFKQADVEHDVNFWRIVFKQTDFAKEVKTKVGLTEKELIDKKAMESWDMINDLRR